MKAAHIHVEDDLRATLESASGDRQELWFRSESVLTPPATADSFLLGSLLLWMQAGTSVEVHGGISHRLLSGLDEWQAAWALWRPERYSRVDIVADEVCELRPQSDRAVVAFSGGVDASYSARRHLTGAAGWQTQELEAGLFVHGLDISLNDVHAFERAHERSQRMLEGSGLELLRMSTNLRDLGQNWEDGFALAVASCLTLLAPDFGVGIIGSSEPYDHLVLPWGSNPMTDHLASSGLMEIRHDGAGASRSEKVALIAGWAPARRDLRVCWQGEKSDRNCGRCEKCVRTILNFRAAGAGLPECFDEDASDSLIRSSRPWTAATAAEWRSLVSVAEVNGNAGTWVRAANHAIRKGELIAKARRVPLARTAARLLRRKRR